MGNIVVNIEINVFGGYLFNFGYTIGVIVIKGFLFLGFSLSVVGSINLDLSLNLCLVFGINFGNV